MPCLSLTKAGKPCKAPPLHGTDHCMAHSSEEAKALARFGGAQEGSGRPRRPREIELYQEVADEYREQMRTVLAEGLTADAPVVVGGNSKDAHVEMVPDFRLRLATLKEIVDRLHGKPTQQVESSEPTTLNQFQILIVDEDARELLTQLRRRVAVGRSLQPGRAGTGD